MTNYKDLIKNFTNCTVLVLGDAMLDRYLNGNTERICREAPVPIVDIQELVEMPGGAANAAANLAALGAKTIFLSLIGTDPNGFKLQEELMKRNVDISSLFMEEKIPTMTKTRIIAKDQLLLRFDSGEKLNMSFETEQKIIHMLLEIYPSVDAILISDYGYGMITQRILDTLNTLQKNKPKILVVDAKFPLFYKDFTATAIKPNYKEAMDILHLSEGFPTGQRSQKIIEYREDFLAKLQCDIVAITLDSEGAVIVDRKGNFYQTHTTPQADSKAAGAGDTYVSTLLLALASGASLESTAELAASASQITLQKSATANCTNEELLASYNNKNKLLTPTNYEKTISLLHATNKHIVFTNGCFDILHPGHVQYLSSAKSLGDILVVGINSDKSVRSLKGNNRPINTLTDRIHVLSALSSIDYIIPFDENTPSSLIQKIKPEIYVKGGDYTKDTLPETALVEEYGGKVIILPFVKEKSTTDIIQKITRHYTPSQNIL